MTLSFLARGAFAATITVTGTGDTNAVDGLVTLREAITSINNGANLNADVVAVGTYGTNDTINFSIGTGVQTITPSGSQLPALNKAVVINGTTQPGFTGTPIIVLDGVSAGPFSRGLTLNAGSSTVRGLVVIRFFDGIEMITNGGNVIAGNYIGIDATGTLARGNTGSGGVLVNTDSNNNTIGGTTSADRNVISGNAEGIQISGASGTVILGNYIGTNPAGTAAVANGESIDMFGNNTTIGGTTGTTPGGPCTGACNLISGNQIGPVVNFGRAGTQILGNLIGTNAAGTGALGNVAGGIVLNGDDNTVGGLTASAGNVIAFNGQTIEGGISVGGTGNAILGNSIFSSLGLGIDLSPNGVTPNDVGDSDTGSNNLQNFPLITSAVVTAGSATVSGTLNSTANSRFRVEVFASAACDPSGNGEGQTFIGSFSFLTDGSGNATFGPSIFPVPGGQSVITATATLLDIETSAPIETSEFSPCFVQVGPTNTPTSTPTNTPTSTPTNTPAGVATNTPTSTPTNAPTNTPTRTPTVGQGPAAVVPTLSFPMLGLLALALAAAAILLFRRF
jgi:hypothetical protein